MPDDQTLLLRYARSRDAEAFAHLVKRYSALVFSVASRVTGNNATAEDVTQDCFFALARQASSIRGSLAGWLHRVALNRSMQVTRNEARRQRREAQVSLPAESDYDSNWNEIAPLVDAALEKLPNDLHEPLVQHFLLGHTQSQIAENLGIDQSTISRRLRDGIERLREHLKQTGVVCGTIVLSTALVKNASAAVPAKLSASLAKMALVGPVKMAATASTTTIASHGSLSLFLTKGALTLMALTKLQTAVIAGAAIILTASTATVVVYEHQHYPWQVESQDGMILDQVPPQVKIVPTIFTPREGWTGRNNKFLGMGQSINTLLVAAYNTGKYRMVYETKPPEDRYDFIANLPEGNNKALQQELERQFNLTAKSAKRNIDVLLLTVKYRNAPGLKLNTSNCNSSNIESRAGRYYCVNVPLSNLAVLLEYYFEIPVVDRTGIAGKFDINIRWQERNWRDNPAALKQVLLEKLGLELVPGRETIDMLVVKRAH
jgi:uncharacterized protein (TIGR03435 family)